MNKADLANTALLNSLVAEHVSRALVEDLGGRGDITSQATIPVDHQACFVIRARAAGVLSGVQVAHETFRQVDPALVLDWRASEGDRLEAGDIAVSIAGSARSILTAERTALNFLGRLSGIATHTRAFVEAVAGTGVAIAHTRKTTPGLRALELQAVAAGGGAPHRFGLDDAVLIKDNHVAVCGGVAEALRRARKQIGHMTRVAVEIDRLDQLNEALESGAESILLDNFAIAELLSAVVVASPSGVVLEASGGIDLDGVRMIAETGVDVISIGAITHSAPNLDLGMDPA
ncbi:MAG: carboxylating nicotinate-nucleotide diphosphorylase [Xanthomonadaceae bacterium]|nr:carboxylating nicotinate-nucleotide diphosphorylase [Xanthomonadaceae bacterium]